MRRLFVNTELRYARPGDLLVYVVRHGGEVAVLVGTLLRWEEDGEYIRFADGRVLRPNDQEECEVDLILPDRTVRYVRLFRGFVHRKWVGGQGWTATEWQTYLESGTAALCEAYRTAIRVDVAPRTCPMESLAKVVFFADQAMNAMPMRRKRSYFEALKLMGSTQRYNLYLNQMFPVLGEFRKRIRRALVRLVNAQPDHVRQQHLLFWETADLARSPLRVLPREVLGKIIGFYM